MTNIAIHSYWTWWFSWFSIVFFLYIYQRGIQWIDPFRHWPLLFASSFCASSFARGFHVPSSSWGELQQHSWSVCSAQCHETGSRWFNLLGLYENMVSTPKNPMVLLIIIPTKWLFHWGILGVYPIFRHTHLASRWPSSDHRFSDFEFLLNLSQSMDWREHLIEETVAFYMFLPSNMGFSMGFPEDFPVQLSRPRVLRRLTWSWRDLAWPPQNWCQIFTGGTPK